METEKYYVEIACNGSVLAERDTYEAAEKLIRQYEADDTIVVSSFFHVC